MGRAKVGAGLHDADRFRTPIDSAAPQGSNDSPTLFLRPSDPPRSVTLRYDRNLRLAAIEASNAHRTSEMLTGPIHCV